MAGNRIGANERLGPNLRFARGQELFGKEDGVESPKPGI
jgi:hypothetical protein